ncbi:AP endonuclease [Spirochaetia bacterium]|nr:AP endonuclease [Spirochaetia bacterium]
MATILYGSPTFILRKEAEKDLFAVTAKLAALGYNGVELLGFFGKKPAEIRAGFAASGIAAMGDHVPIKDFLSDPGKVINEHLEAGCKYLTIAHQEGQFKPGASEWLAMLDDMRSLIGKCRAAGITPLYHNHGWDVRAEPDGASYAGTLLDALVKDGLCFEPDLGWMVYSSACPADYLRRYREACKVLHLKDVYADDYARVTRAPGDVKRDPSNGGFEFRPTGYGTVNFPQLMPLCLACDPEWLIIDHDLSYERDPYADMKLSLDYVKNLVQITGR